jgi:hypothetical protein
MKRGRMRKGPRGAGSLMPRKNPLICDHFAIIFYQTEAFALQYRSKHRHFSSNLFGERNNVCSRVLHWANNLGVRFHAATSPESTDTWLKPRSCRTPAMLQNAHVLAGSGNGSIPPIPSHKQDLTRHSLRSQWSKMLHNAPALLLPVAKARNPEAVRIPRRRPKSRAPEERCR